jgi:acyl carrier protein
MDDAEILERLREAVAEETGALGDSVKPSISASLVPGWDSLAHMRVIMNFEARVGVEIDMDETYRMATIGDLIKLVRRDIAAKENRAAAG